MVTKKSYEDLLFYGFVKGSRSLVIFCFQFYSQISSRRAFTELGYDSNPHCQCYLGYHSSVWQDVFVVRF